MIKYINFKFYKSDICIGHATQESIHTKFKNLGITSSSVRVQLINTIQRFFADNPISISVWLYVSPTNPSNIVIAKNYYPLFDSKLGSLSASLTMETLRDRSRAAFTNFRARASRTQESQLNGQQEVYSEVSMRTAGQVRSNGNISMSSELIDVHEYLRHLREANSVPPPVPTSPDDWEHVVSVARDTMPNFYTPYGRSLRVRPHNAGRNVRKSPSSRSAITKRILKEIKSDMKLDTLDKNIVDTVFKLTAKFNYHSLKPEPRGDFTFPSWMI